MSDQIQQAVPANAETTALLDPSGQIVHGPTQYVPIALQAGYQLATPEAIKEFQNQQKYGEGLGNELKAGVLGVGEGATFGGSTWLLSKTGLVDPETIKQLEERNPIAHGVGMVGGVIGSSLVGSPIIGGVSKLGAGATGLAANLGERGVAALAEAGAPTAARVLDYASQIGSKAIGSAVEGAIYGGVGNTVTEHALGDPDLNAEKILSNFGYGALIGGSIGASMKGLQLGVPPAYGSSKAALNKLYNSMVGEANEVAPKGVPWVEAQPKEPGLLSKGFAKTSSMVSGVPSQDILQGIQNRAGGIAEGLKTGTGSGDVSKLLEVGAFVHNPLTAPLIEGVKALADPGRTIEKLVHVEKIVNKMTNAIEKGAKGLFDVSSSALEATKGLVSEELTAQTLADAHMEFAQNLNQQMQDPDHFINTVTQETSPLYNVAPNITDGINLGIARASNFLQSKLPPEVQGGVLNERTMPSDADISKFQRYQHIVENPLQIYDQVKNGTITPEAVETLQTVYPKLYGNIKQAITENIMGLKNPNEIPYQTKLSLSMLMGEPLDQSLKPNSIASNQQLTNIVVQNQQVPHPKRSKSKNPITLSERSQTSFQQAANRQS